MSGKNKVYVNSCRRLWTKYKCCVIIKTEEYFVQNKKGWYTMKTALKLTALVMIAAIVVCAFAACTASLEKQIVGKWSDADSKYTVEFKEDGTFNYKADGVNILGVSLGADVNGTYTVDTEADPATVTVVPEISIGSFKAGTQVTFTATYEDGVLTLSNDNIGSNSLTKVEQ